MSAPLEFSLAATSDDIEVPFELQVWEEAEAGVAVAEPYLLRCEETLRYLPGRRLVARTRWAGRPAVLKLFIGEGALGYRDRELAGLAALRTAGARVPERLALVRQASADVGIISGLVADARNLCWQDGAVVDELVRLFARMHALGISHTDPHLGNFLCTAHDPRELHVVDGDGIRLSDHPLSEADSLADLSRLLAQFSPAADSLMEGLICIYAEERGWQAEGLVDRAIRSLVAARADRYRRYLKKTRRACSEFQVELGASSLRARLRERADEVPGMFFTAPDELLDSGQSLKAGNSATVARWRRGASAPAATIAASATLVVKRYNVKGPVQALRRSLSPLPRFRRAWSYGALLHLLDIPTARPLALLEKGIGPWRPRAWLLLEDLGDRNLSMELQAALTADDDARINARTDEVVSLFKALAAAGLVHGDTKATNFLIHRDIVHLIDLDGMTLHSTSTKDRARGDRARRRDIARFLENWEGILGARFEAAFRAAGLL